MRKKKREKNERGTKKKQTLSSCLLIKGFSVRTNNRTKRKNNKERRKEEEKRTNKERVSNREKAKTYSRVEILQWMLSEYPDQLGPVHEQRTALHFAVHNENLPVRKRKRKKKSLEERKRKRKRKKRKRERTRTRMALLHFVQNPFL